MFTIIIPTHDRPLLLRRALQSLVAQTFTDFQVIIVDDAASFIPPFEELAALRGRYTHVIRSGAPGPAESRNVGLRLATSRYVMFLDDDDSYEPGHLRALADHLAAAPAAGLLFCDFKVQTEDRTVSPPRALSLQAANIADADVRSVYVRNRIPNSCIVYPRELLEGLHHDPALPIYEDWDFLLACLKRSPGLTYLPLHSVVIHKSHGEAPQNQRRGNHREDLIVGMTLFLYRKHPSPDAATHEARRALLAQAGITFEAEPG